MNLIVDNTDRNRTPLLLLMLLQVKVTGQLEQVLVPQPDRAAEFLPVSNAVVMFIVGISVVLLMYAHPSPLSFWLDFKN
jgi:hypothetical protein